MRDRGGTGDAPIVLRFRNDVRKIVVKEEIVQRRIPLVCFDNPI